MHRIIACDPAAPVKSIAISTTDTLIGDGSANATKINTSDGHQSMIGNARPWRDEPGDITNIKTTGPGVTINDTELTIDFVNTSDENDYAYKNFQINHDVEESTVKYPHIHFFAGYESVVPNFLLWYRWQTLGATKVTAWTKLKCNTLALTAPGAGVTQHNICRTASGITPPGGASISDIVQFRIIRDTGNTSGLFAGADPYTGTVAILGFDVHVQLNSLGSTGQFTK
jgi:hypothetical protein